MGSVQGKLCLRASTLSDSDEKDEEGMGQGTSILADDTTLEVVDVPSHNFRLVYTVLTQRGFYPDSPDKENQDSYCIRTNIQDNPNVHFFGVFDGHGVCGAQCSSFVKDRLLHFLSNDDALLDDPIKAYSAAFLATNADLRSSHIDDSMSGTTAITALVVGDKLYVANVGDSRAVLGFKVGNQVLAQNLSSDQTPFRKDECERVKLAGARVMTADQVEGIKDPTIQSWGDEETEGSDPPRLWVQNGMYPGTAFTRSIGDSTAESIGVVADPEVSIVQLTLSHPFFIIASDGIFEFLSSQTVVNMVVHYSLDFVLLPISLHLILSRYVISPMQANRHPDPRDACLMIAGESYKIWLQNESRTDDITIIIVQIKGLNAA